MAEDIEIKPDSGEPPKVNPLAGVAPVKAPTVAAKPIVKPAGLAAGLKPGLKLPTQNAMRPGLKLPTQTLKPGLKLPARPVIRKPGSTVASTPLPKPVGRAEIAKPEAAEKPMESLKAVTQKMKGITQEIPQQAILRKTGIIAEDATTEAQKEAAKHKTARISLSDAIGVAPVKNENAPMKTIRIKRPIDIPTPTASLKPQPPAPAAAPAAAETQAPAAEDKPADAVAPTITQRKTLKISRPSGSVRPSGKFGVKRVSQATTADSSVPAAEGADAAPAEISEIPDIPMNVPSTKVVADDGPAWLWTLSTLVQAAACIAMGALAWMLFQNTQTAYF